MKMWPELAPFAKTLQSQNDAETLFYYDTEKGGDSKPILALIHGLGDEADSWRHLIPRLRDQFRILALDLPGFGRSVSLRRINLRRHTLAVIRLLEAAGVEPSRPAALAGSSMGAIIAEEAAFVRPELVRAIILLDGCMPSSLPLSGKLLIMALPFIGKRWYRAYRINHEGAYQSLLPYYDDLPGMSEEDRRFLRERVIARVESPSQERAYFASLRSLIWMFMTQAGSFVRRFTAFPGKVLILWGDTDRIQPPDSAQILRDLRPDTVFKIIPAAGHLPHQENPVDVADVISEFWFSTAASGAAEARTE